jgi:outer membrane lipoprotein SlyB
MKLIIALALIGIFNLSIAQDKPVDKIVMLDGEERLGKVMEVDETSIKFTYANETLVYEIKKKEINKIQFGSGRIEFITQAPQDNNTQSGLEPHHNVVAILPFTYTQVGGGLDEKMGLKVQSDCYALMKKYAVQFTFQDPLNTNATLVKNGMNENTIAGLTPAEIANLLNVEYIVFGTVVVSQTGSTTGGGSVSTDKNKGNKIIGYVVGSSTTTINYRTSVDMKIYNDQGQNIFIKSHESFWPTMDAYTVTLQYLVKRTPLYSK